MIDFSSTGSTDDLNMQGAPNNLQMTYLIDMLHTDLKLFSREIQDLRNMAYFSAQYATGKNDSAFRDTLSPALEGFEFKKNFKKIVIVVKNFFIRFARHVKTIILGLFKKSADMKRAQEIERALCVYRKTITDEVPGEIVPSHYTCLKVDGIKFEFLSNIDRLMKLDEEPDLAILTKLKDEGERLINVIQVTTFIMGQVEKVIDVFAGVDMKKAEDIVKACKKVHVMIPADLCICWMNKLGKVAPISMSAIKAEIDNEFSRDTFTRFLGPLGWLDMIFKRDLSKFLGNLESIVSKAKQSQADIDKCLVRLNALEKKVEQQDDAVDVEAK